jgi:hypothetical protein
MHAARNCIELHHQVTVPAQSIAEVIVRTVEIKPWIHLHPSNDSLQTFRLYHQLPGSLKL